MAKTAEPVASLLEPEWEDARLFPARSALSDQEYLDLETNRIAEFDQGSLEVHPMPTQSHQQILLYVYRLLAAFVQAGKRGTVLLAALPVRLWPRKFREPDLLFMLAAHDHRRHGKFWEGADLVMEVVSDDPKSRTRDLETKRVEYARAGIPEYWIVDPEEQRVTVLTLAADSYRVHGQFAPGTEAVSKLLPEFKIAVSDLFAAAD